MHFVTAAVAASLAALVTAAPTKTLVERASQCSQYAEVATGDYTIYNNLWGEDNGSGSQCFSVSKLSGKTLSWDTTWSWSGGANDVKSYANVVTKLTSRQIHTIKSMDSTWSWSYSGSNIVADVSYDMFTSSTAGGSNEYEIMVWLAALGGAGPISSTYGSNGKPTAIATATIDGHSFDLYKGPNGDTTVYSFVASNQVKSFSGDVHKFFKYLTGNGHLAHSQYLTSVGAGTEAFTGSKANFKTSAFSMSIV